MERLKNKEKIEIKSNEKLKNNIALKKNLDFFCNFEKYYQEEIERLKKITILDDKIFNLKIRKIILKKNFKIFINILKIGIFKKYYEIKSYYFLTTRVFQNFLKKLKNSIVSKKLKKFSLTFLYSSIVYSIINKFKIGVKRNFQKYKVFKIKNTLFLRKFFRKYIDYSIGKYFEDLFTKFFEYFELVFQIKEKISEYTFLKQNINLEVFDFSKTLDKKRKDLYCQIKNINFDKILSDKNDFLFRKKKIIKKFIFEKLKQISKKNNIIFLSLKEKNDLKIKSENINIIKCCFIKKKFLDSSFNKYNLFLNERIKKRFFRKIHLFALKNKKNTENLILKIKLKKLISFKIFFLKYYKQINEKKIFEDLVFKKKKIFFGFLLKNKIRILNVKIFHNKKSEIKNEYRNRKKIFTFLKKFINYQKIFKNNLFRILIFFEKVILKIIFKKIIKLLDLINKNLLKNKRKFYSNIFIRIISKKIQRKIKNRENKNKIKNIEKYNLFSKFLSLLKNHQGEKINHNISILFYTQKLKSRFIILFKSIINSLVISKNNYIKALIFFRLNLIKKSIRSLNCMKKLNQTKKEILKKIIVERKDIIYSLLTNKLLKRINLSAALNLTKNKENYFHLVKELRKEEDNINYENIGKKFRNKNENKNFFSYKKEEINKISNFIITRDNYKKSFLKESKNNTTIFSPQIRCLNSNFNLKLKLNKISEDINTILSIKNKKKSIPQTDDI